MADIIERIVNYLDDHRCMSLATVSPEDQPMTATASYANDGMTIYFSTGRTTAKFKNISKASNVALTVDEDYDDWGIIQGVQLRGNAKMLEGKEEVKNAQSILECKFPQMEHMPENVNFEFFKIEPTVAYFLDNSKGFRHRDQVVL